MIYGYRIASLHFLANGIDFHNLVYLGTSTSKRLSDVGEWTAATDLLIRLHGALMLASWLGTAAIGMLLARYYRQTWVNSQLCGKDHWFAVSAEFSGNSVFRLILFPIFQNDACLFIPVECDYKKIKVSSHRKKISFNLR